MEHSSREIGQAIAQARAQRSITDGSTCTERGHPIAIWIAMCRTLRKAVLAASLLALPLSQLWAQKIYFDMTHGEAPWPPQMGVLGKRVGYQIEAGNGPAAAEALAGSRLIYLRAPNRAFQDSEKQAIISFVKAGGSLLLVLDEEERQKLAVVGVNDVIAPFGLKLSGDTPRIVNTGAVARAGEIHKADREIPYDGGRQVLGGTPFAYQLDREGNPAQPSAAYVKLDNGARIVVMGEGMASLFLGVPEGVRLTIEPANPKWWGKDSLIFMEEVLTWLLAR